MDRNLQPAHALPAAVQPRLRAAFTRAARPQEYTQRIVDFIARSLDFAENKAALCPPGDDARRHTPAAGAVLPSIGLEIRPNLREADAAM